MDQDCLETTCNSAVSLDTSYRLTPSEIETMVKLRMTNRAYFSGKKNECMRGWRAILKHMGLHTKLNYYQAAKKWDNMRMRYKELKYPPEGAVLPPAWWGFKLMDNAMHGLLDSSAPIIALPPSDEDADFLPYKRRREHPRAPPRPPPLGGADASEIEVSLLDSGEEQQEEEEVELRRTLGLQRERAGLEREEAGLGRQRAALERERTAVEREKALLARERAVLERERTELSRDRLAMERGRGRPARDGGVNGGVTGGVNGGMDDFTTGDVV
uniref:Si:dkeyp-38g8.5 n=1 Tax=Gadus morhua TaxID=8049 RepID=A0A8C5CER2_GADMO